MARYGKQARNPFDLLGYRDLASNVVGDEDGLAAATGHDRTATGTGGKGYDEQRRDQKPGESASRFHLAGSPSWFRDFDRTACVLETMPTGTICRPVRAPPSG